MSTLLEKAGIWAQLLISLLVIGAFIGTIAALLLTPVNIDGGVREVLLVLVGVLAGAFKDCIGFFMGSSHGSAVKTEMQKQ